MTLATATAEPSGAAPGPSAPLVRANMGDRRIDAVGYLFVAFFTVPFFLFNVLPVFFGVYVAFTRWNIVGSPHWIGTANFTAAFKDKWVWTVFENAFLYGLVIVPGRHDFWLAVRALSSTSAIRFRAWRARCSSRPTSSPPP